MAPSFAAAVAAASLVALAGLHSWLGERLILRPLFAAEAWPRLPLGRPFSQATLRFAWHLTSVAWLGLAALLVGAEGPRVPAVVAAVLLASGCVTLAGARGRHFAWALFFTGAIAAARQAGLLGAGALPAVAASLGAIFAALALLHVAWALGLRLGFAAAIPTVDGHPAFHPGAALTLLVAALLALAAWLALGLGGHLPAPPAAALLGLGGALALGARTVGEFRTVGLFKRIRGTAFARRDDLLYTPLCFFLAAGMLLLALGGR
jgi:hypothetical protein